MDIFIMARAAEKPIVWMGSSQKDLREFPKEVRQEIGVALYWAQGQAMTKRINGRIDCTAGSGNVFRDVGLDSPEEEMSKASLALQIHERVKALGLNVTAAAVRLRIPQPKASRLLRGYTDGFSAEKLLTCLTMLGQDVRIVVSDAEGQSGRGKFLIMRSRPAAARKRPARRAPRATGRP